MLFSTIGGKEIVNLCDGSRLGIIAESDLLIDERTGRIISLLIPDKKGILSFFSNDSSLEIPWEAVKKIGNDMIIIELEDENKRRHSF
ncbi:YlmC/YmxH family sporulation protein [Serpentinicella alkaliphila]|uniref:YlmC/YmxH family sporulation protein n=1 Tax=Serpentinicella alkaliphila TaxID=1734049 RepID=A0A4R2SPD3_9FIRM|nr:YlmC/YmxH family sporulation protein [Serpentinicella alkaliphila]QUH26335.1 YlmC/YmxH family sporulation protein [Serpentinicella alkaliphila]TCP91997.1 YlmC/YmxH family sporulation protein [Serpentinicella alkaliphila]